VHEARDRSGRMAYRLWYEEAEIDSIMEDELRRAGSPRIGAGAVDIDLFIERHLRISPQFEALPRGVQGATDFFPDGSVEMRISATLSSRAAEMEPGAENLMRTTLAHEAAHVLLHRVLFLRQPDALFEGDTSRRELCRDVRPVGKSYSGEWWEWQANRGMGALLMPRSEVASHARAERSGGHEDTGALINSVAEMFLVSREAARLRLEQLAVSTDPHQVSWSF
jgi:IrrE N-terminal-like domain